jgi:hypothetical protein
VVVFFSRNPDLRSPVRAHNLHKNIYLRKIGQNQFGVTMKREKEPLATDETNLASGSTVPFFKGLRFRAFNCCFCLGWGLSPFLVALASHLVLITALNHRLTAVDHTFCLSFHTCRTFNQRLSCLSTLQSRQRPIVRTDSGVSALL